MSVLSNSPHSDDQNFKIKHEGNRHSYFLRAKTNRLMGTKSSDEDFEKSSLGTKFASDHENTEEEDLANCLVMLSNRSSFFSVSGKEQNKAKEMEIKATFQCKSCKKVFSSHQALGGHRASHKRVKGCSAFNYDIENVDQDSIQEDHEFLTPSANTQPTHSPSARRNMPKMHECTVCRRVFSSGQALGGHKRCHWLISNPSDSNSFIPHLQDFEYDHSQQVLYITSGDHHIDLNLNLPISQLSGNAEGNFTDETKLEQRKSEAMDAEKVEKSCTEMKLRELSDLGDVKLDRWLQVGIASSFTDIC